MAEEEDRPSSGFAKDLFAPARKLAVSSDNSNFQQKILAGMVRWSEPVRMVLGNIRSPQPIKIEQGILIRLGTMLRAGWPPFAQGVCPQIRPPDPGGLASGLEGLVLGAAQPPPPLFLLVRSNQNPQPSPLLLI